MPRKTKEQTEIEKEENKRNTTKKATKTSTAKKDTTAKSATKKTSTVKKATTKKSSTAKKTTTKKTATKKTTAKKTSTKKTSAKKATTKKEIEIVEYYDLPYRYNQTVVKVLAQTPTTLFIYWDISDKDRKAFEEQYGEKFFEQTKPVLIVKNDTLNYSFEVEINDFANSWYLHINDSKCDYKVELGRRPIVKNEKIDIDYIYISASNEIETPNDRILFDKNQKMVYFRNTKTGVQTSKDITSISFIRNMGKIYNIYDLYKAIYQNENIENIYNLSNPSSGNPTSRNVLM